MSVELNTDIDDPVQYFLDEQDLLGKSDKSISEYRRILRNLEDFAADPSRNPEGESMSLSDVNRRVCLGWIKELRNADQELSDSTIATYASKANTFYQYLAADGVFAANPMARVVEQIPEEIETEPVRRDISITEMAEFVQSIQHPLHLAVVLTLLKTGVRAGELVNLDIRDVHIADSDVKDKYPEIRPVLEDRPDAIFVESKVSVGDVVNGEERTTANKRKRDTIIPIDDELKDVLGYWLSVRPDAVSPADPLFVNTHAWGVRYRYEPVRRTVTNLAKRQGWYDSDADRDSNVTPHYFRHFFTTYMRRRMDDESVVKYLRGDLGDDIMDTYTHNWGDRVRKQYESSIYRLL